MMEFLLGLGINMKAFVAACMTVWTLLSANGMNVDNANNMLEYISCLTVDEYGDYVVALECTQDIVEVDGELTGAGTMDYLEVGSSLGEAIDYYLDMKEDYAIMEEYSVEWRTYSDYKAWEALQEAQG